MDSHINAKFDFWRIFIIIFKGKIVGWITMEEEMFSSVADFISAVGFSNALDDR